MALWNSGILGFWNNGNAGILGFRNLVIPEVRKCWNSGHGESGAFLRNAVSATITIDWGYPT